MKELINFYLIALVGGMILLSFLGIHEERTWYDGLPKCPCSSPDLDSLKLGDGWAQDRGDISYYHPGATSCYRSYPPVATTKGKSCQQCCYNAAGNLIINGQAAGTPDKVSVCKGELKNGQMKIRRIALWGHYLKDVKPWKKHKQAGTLELYWKDWPPDVGIDCLSD